MTNENPIKTTVEELKKLINIDNFIGEPIETEDKILIPVMKMGFGFAGGENKKDADNIAASGAAAGVEPVAMVVISKNVQGSEGIKVLNITKGSELNKAISDLGLIVTDIIKEYIPSNKDSSKVKPQEESPSETKNIEIEPEEE